MAKDSLIGRRKRGSELMRSTSALFGPGRSAGGTSIAEELPDLGSAIKALNAEANKIGKSDPNFADELRKRALKLANKRKRR